MGSEFLGGGVVFFLFFLVFLPKHLLSLTVSPSPSICLCQSVPDVWPVLIPEGGKERTRARAGEAVWAVARAAPSFHPCLLVY